MQGNEDKPGGHLEGLEDLQLNRLRDEIVRRLQTMREHSYLGRLRCSVESEGVGSYSAACSQTNRLEMRNYGLPSRLRALKE
jgi:hypothetical protein